MKQYTDESQIAKLIELGFEKPKFEIETQLCNIKGQPLRAAIIVGDYSIGELISFLPKEIDYNGFNNTLHIFVNQVGWNVEYTDFLGELYSVYRAELVDALYDMVVKLKEEGVI